MINSDHSGLSASFDQKTSLFTLNFRLSCKIDEEMNNFCRDSDQPEYQGTGKWSQSTSFFHQPSNGRGLLGFSVLSGVLTSLAYISKHKEAPTASGQHTCKVPPKYTCLILLINITILGF